MDIDKIQQHPWYEMVHESNTIEGFPNDMEMDLASLKALEALSILSVDAGLNHHIIRRIQEDITASQHDLWYMHKGAYRSQTMTDVSVGNIVLPHWHQVNHLMDQWLENFHTRSPRENHVAFEKIHPFTDGNGRTGRILMWWQEMAEGGEPTIIRSNEADKHYYYQWFKD